MTPCIGVCTLTGGICDGCNRTLDEIARWGKLDMAERMELMQRLIGEKPTSNCSKCGAPIHCDVMAGKSGCDCWCGSLDHVTSKALSELDPSEASCMCRSCLRQLAASEAAIHDPTR